MLASLFFAVPCASRIPLPHGPVPKYEERIYKQQLDHFHPESKTTWDHRYLYSDEHWNGKGELENGCKGPILLYTGNEVHHHSFLPLD